MIEQALAYLGAFDQAHESKCSMFSSATDYFNITIIVDWVF